MLIDSIKKQVVDAMKAKDATRVSTLRMLSSELKNAQIDKRGTLDGEDEIKVVKREAKKRKDAIEAFEKGGRGELAENEKKELNVLQEYLPEEMSDQELAGLVKVAFEESGVTSTSDFGTAMSAVMKKIAGQADGKRVAEIVRRKLAK